MIRNLIIGAVALTAISVPISAFAADHAVAIQGMKFSVKSLELAVGDTIIFTNMDGAPHTATAKDGSFDTGRLGKGESATVTISAAGTYAYFCKVHPSMTAKVVAQ